MRIVAAYLLCATHAFAPPTPSLRAPTALHAENPVRKYGGSVVLGLLGIQSIRDLVLEVPKLGSDQADYFGTAIDVAFTAFVATQLATQSGVAQPDGGEPLPEGGTPEGGKAEGKKHVDDPRFNAEWMLNAPEEAVAPGLREPLAVMVQWITNMLECRKLQMEIDSCDHQIEILIVQL